MQLNADWAGETVAWLRQRKVNLRPLFADLGIDPRELKFGRQIDAKHFDAILDFGATALGDEHFGLHRGAAFHMKHGGVLAYLAVCAETVKEALQGFQRYASVACDGLAAELKPERGGIQLIVRASDPIWRQSPHLSAFSSARMIAALRAITGVALSPLEVRLMHPRRGTSAEGRRFFGCPVEYGGPADIVRFSKESLAVRIPTADSRLGHILRAYADALLHQMPPRLDASLEERVMAIVAERLCSGGSRCATSPASSA